MAAGTLALAAALLLLALQQPRGAAAAAVGAAGPAASRRALQQEQPGAQQEPRKWASDEEALSAPVVVAIKSGHFFGGQYAREVPQCPFQVRAGGRAGLAISAYEMSVRAPPALLLLLS